MAPPHWTYSTHKGGTGKTLELLVNAAAAAEAGDRVLVVDMDAQANATRRLSAKVPNDPEERAKASLAGILVDTKPARGDVARILTPCGWGGIYTEHITVAPGHLELEFLARTAAQASSERRLLTALAGVVDDYDVIMIDTPPQLLSHLIDNAWTASDLLWIPTTPEYDPIEAARRVVQRCEQERDTLNPDLMVGGFLINFYRQQLTLHRQRAEEVAEILGPDAVCPVWLPDRVALKNAGEMTKPLAELGPDGREMATLARDIYAWMRERTRTLMGEQ